MFFLTEDSVAERKKLKTFSGTTRAGKHVLKLEVEYGSAMDMALDLEGLQRVADAQKPKRKPATRGRKAPAKPRQITNKKPLALPAPGEFE
ncbi:hypothetical protein RA27_20425 [Ruegeria sp. ANG-R]|uniref:hypothetical protein n=1 Tax=Ruegeria sp. ANG-R TaxID=1577903 RepID=UPI00057F2F35|nr:hypothetical protein [Ruegeria sp. ANG-R]KIC38139.1 hypothetical protein RA27_20425 [Ruegeria sp. ANG-R]